MKKYYFFINNEYKNGFNSIEEFWMKNLGIGERAYYISDDLITPKVDMYCSEGQLIINVELPGVLEDDIKLFILEKKIKLVAKRVLPEESKGNTCYRVEILYGTIERDIDLPEEVDYNSIESKLNHGILTIRINIDQKDNEVNQNKEGQEE